MDRNKRISTWTPEKLAALSDEAFISAFVLAIEDRTNLRDGDLTIENKVKKGAPPESVEMCLREAARREIPQSAIAQRIAARAKQGKSFISNVVAPATWREYEIQAAKAILAWVQQDGIKLDRIDFDARLVGRVTKSERQIDLWLESFSPAHSVAVECKDYNSSSIAVDKLEAFRTKLEDVGAKKGLFVTRNGYQRSSMATAQYYGIVLLTFDKVDKDNPPKDLNEQQRSEIRSTQNDFWCLRHGEAAWYFGGN